MNAEQRARELAEEKISGRSDLFIVDIRLQGGILNILVDGDNGLNVQDCADISRHVGYHLEEENVLNEAYTLEVSSPGIDTPLKLERQYVKNQGRNLSIKLMDGSKWEGKLLKAEPGEIFIEKTGNLKGKKPAAETIVIPLDQIIEARVLISFK